MQKTSRGGWVAINCIPTSVHTIAGALVGKFLMGDQAKKEKTILMIGIALLLVGYSMDFFQITPIIKRIATSSFTIVSLGWCMAFFGICYYLFDVKKGKDLLFFKVLSMNSIFIYLFFETVGGGWLNQYMSLLVSGLFQPFSIPEITTSIIASISVFAVEWSICLFLFRKKIFFRL
jgi:predicted acyltransferase